jgi:hypothetical protein
MAHELRHAARCWTVLGAMLGALAAPPPAAAADIGGFLADQQKARAAAAEKSSAEACPQLIARAAASDDTGLAGYRAALCYLQADPPDAVAAKAWLTRSSDAGFMPAHRLLRALAIAEAGPHGTAPHCHVLGEGQQLCHGGAAPLPLAAATR